MFGFNFGFDWLERLWPGSPNAYHAVPSPQQEQGRQAAPDVEEALASAAPAPAPVSAPAPVPDAHSVHAVASSSGTTPLSGFESAQSSFEEMAQRREPDLTVLVGETAQQRPSTTSSWHTIEILGTLVNSVLHGLGTVVPTTVLNFGTAIQTALYAAGKTDPAQLTHQEQKGIYSAVPFMLLSSVTNVKLNWGALQVATLSYQLSELGKYFRYLWKKLHCSQAAMYTLLLGGAIVVSNIDGFLINTGSLEGQDRSWNMFLQMMLSNGLSEMAAFDLAIFKQITMWTYSIMYGVANGLGASIIAAELLRYFFMDEHDLNDQRQIRRQIKHLEYLKRRLDTAGLPEKVRILMNARRYFSERFLSEFIVQAISPPVPAIDETQEAEGGVGLIAQDSTRSAAARLNSDPELIARESRHREMFHRRYASDSVLQVGRRPPPSPETSVGTIHPASDHEFSSSSSDEDSAESRTEIESIAQPLANQFLDRLWTAYHGILLDNPEIKDVAWVLAAAAAYQVYIAINKSIQQALQTPPLPAYDHFLRAIGCESISLIELWNAAGMVKMSMEARSGIQWALELFRDMVREGRATTFWNRKTAHFALTTLLNLFTVLPWFVISRANFGPDPLPVLLPFILGYFSCIPPMSASASYLIRKRDKFAAVFCIRQGASVSDEDRLQQKVSQFLDQWVTELKKAELSDDYQRALHQAAQNLKAKLDEPEFVELYERLRPTASFSSRSRSTSPDENADAPLPAV